MKKFNVFVFTIVLIFLYSIYSCKKDSNSSDSNDEKNEKSVILSSSSSSSNSSVSSILSSGKWFLDSFVRKEDGKPEYFDTLRNCDKDDYIQYKINGDCSYTFGADQCDSTESYPDSIYWNLSDDKKYLILLRGAARKKFKTYEILFIDNKVLKLKYFYEPTNYYSRVTYINK
jgi:hypothetical protein